MSTPSSLKTRVTHRVEPSQTEWRSCSEVSRVGDVGGRGRGGGVEWEICACGILGGGRVVYLGEGEYVHGDRGDRTKVKMCENCVNKIKLTRMQLCLGGECAHVVSWGGGGGGGHIWMEGTVPDISHRQSYGVAAGGIGLSASFLRVSR